MSSQQTITIQGRVWIVLAVLKTWGGALRRTNYHNLHDPNQREHRLTYIAKSDAKQPAKYRGRYLVLQAAYPVAPDYYFK